MTEKAYRARKPLAIWGVYRTCGGTYHAIEFLCATGQLAKSGNVISGGTLDEVRAGRPEDLLTCPRCADDDPNVVEVWL